MRKANCTTCNTAIPLSSAYRVDDAVYCEACANKRFDEMKAAGKVPRVTTITDPTICAKCGLDSGNSELSLTAGLPFCMPCSQAVMERPFPTWLKGSLAFVFALLLVALWHGRPYFKAGKSLARGERLLEQQRYAEAIPYLQPVVQSAPECEKCILLLAKAQLLTGDVEAAQKTFGGRTQFEKNDLSDEVLQIWDRAVRAVDTAGEASKLSDQKKDEEAAAKMNQAATLYPEMKGLSITAEYYDAAVAFDHKDYNRFEQIAETAWKQQPDSAGAVAMLASAVACQYAITGDSSYRRRAEELLERARVLAQSSPNDQKNYQEYVERIRYRLQSREIIDKDEYDRRFRQNSSTKGKG
ncbi:MAG TPA: tetratricopeptide repeat protein [Terriglobales bacterium]|jgi:hypothetical protein|nr:tetratricopeptide repeat protein [Terriglobales bacterium]